MTGWYIDGILARSGRHVVKITEVKVTLIHNGEDRLKAFCSITLDNEFVVRDVKVISGPKGLFVAMPSRRITTRCCDCNGRIDADAAYCSNCGQQQPRIEVTDEPWRPFADVAHPINPQCRAQIAEAVLASYHAEVRRSTQQ